MDARRAFTLLELLIVVATIALLSAIASGALAHAERVGRATATRGVLQRVETALGLFAGEAGAHPWRDVAAGDPLPGEGNDLYRRLGGGLDDVARGDLAADLAAAEAAYRGGPHTITDAEVDPLETGGALPRRMHAGLVNRLAAERARIAILAGCTGVRGADLRPEADPASRRNRAVIAVPRSRGWCGDYLSGELTERDVSGEAVVDAYGTPLLYVCPVIRGVRGTLPAISVSGFGNPATPVLEEAYGLETRGRAVTSALASDIRSTASARHRFGFELWSAGPDRRMAAQRNAPEGRDDLAVRGYRDGLAP
jgi:prepilin-type N-terminal cleavage/methylation domain-containing protein